ncbi:unnamed protein product [Thlaspi arvense]|uniref:Uncharacterized protein n=1 Tax=Thlaspi arvense TaxID=13288 RepID=A0AAU9RY01_THLAR|nr:unnamed protein product [Thlaspi arvense]
MATLSSSFLLSSSHICKSRFSPTTLISGIDFMSFSPRTTLSVVSPAILSLSVKQQNRQRNSLQGSVKSVASPMETASEFDVLLLVGGLCSKCAGFTCSCVAG